MKVMILDDEPDFLNNYCLYAKWCGYTAIAGDDGTYLSEHWEEVLTCDVIVLDADMPTNGLSCLQILAERQWHKPTLLHHVERWYGNPHLIDLSHLRHVYPFAKFKLKTWDGYHFIKLLNSLNK